MLCPNYLLSALPLYRELCLDKSILVPSKPSADSRLLQREALVSCYICMHAKAEGNAALR